VTVVANTMKAKSFVISILLGSSTASLRTQSMTKRLEKGARTVAIGDVGHSSGTMRHVGINDLDIFSRYNVIGYSDKIKNGGKGGKKGMDKKNSSKNGGKGGKMTIEKGMGMMSKVGKGTTNSGSSSTNAGTMLVSCCVRLIYVRIGPAIHSHDG
jgi:hypothetical protein